MAYPVAHALLFVAWAVGSFYAAQFLVIAGVSVLAETGYPIQETNRVVLTLAISVVMYSIGLVIAVGVPARLFHWSRGYIQQRLGMIGRPQGMHIVVAIISYGIYFLLTAGLLWLATIIIPGFDVGQKQELGFDVFTSWFEVGVAFVAFVVLAPFAEELFFRSFLFGGLKKRIPVWLAAVVTSVIFGFVHGQLNVGIDTFGLSLILCWLYTQAKTIWPAIFLHMFKNGVALASLLAMSSIQ